MTDADSDRDFIGKIFKDSTLLFLFCLVVTVGIVISLYSFITVCLRKRHTSNRRPLALRQLPSELPMAEAEIVPVHKYEKAEGLEGNDVVCAVCLSEFEEGEELRTLPECLHSFHAPCIDMWLSSHTTCPICRANAALNSPSSPQIRRLPPGSDRGELTLDSRVLENNIGIIQSRSLSH